MDTVYELNGITFKWSQEKSESNKDKHGIDFGAACEVFFDPFLAAVDSDAESGETREAVIGLTKSSEMLFVAYSEREDSFRIVSARRVTKAERERYEEE